MNNRCLYVWIAAILLVMAISNAILFYYALNETDETEYNTYLVPSNVTMTIEPEERSFSVLATKKKSTKKTKGISFSFGCNDDSDDDDDENSNDCTSLFENLTERYGLIGAAITVDIIGIFIIAGLIYKYKNSDGDVDRDDPNYSTEVNYPDV